MKFKLDDSQQAAIDTFGKFIVDPDHQFFCLTGLGGSGKSTVMEQMIDTIGNTATMIDNLGGDVGLLKRVHVTATTNPACNAIKFTNAQTIHSFLGLILVRDSVNKRQMNLVPKSDVEEQEPSIIFIDEFSYIDHSLAMYMATYGAACKFVLVGDQDQLTAVKSNYNILHEVNKKYICELTANHRSGGVPDLAKLVKRCKLSVRAGVMPKIDLSENVIAVDQAEFDQLINNDTGSFRVLSYTNSVADAYTQAIHAYRNPNYKGDWLVAPNTLIELQDYVIKPKRLPKGQYKILKAEVNPDHNFLTDLYTSGGIITTTVNRKTPEYQEWAKGYFDQDEITCWDVAQVSLGYSSTVHKAQGAEYDTSYIDLNSFAYAKRNPDMLRRLIYVAISRAKKKVVFTGDL